MPLYLTLLFVLLMCTPSFSAPPVWNKQIAPKIADHMARNEPIDVLILLDDSAELQAESASVLNRAKGRRETKGEYNLRMQNRKDRLNLLKGQFKSEIVGPDLEILGDYSVLPVIHVHVGSAQALNRLIQHGKVLSIDENLRLETTLAQSLPLIGQPTVWNNGSGYGGDGTTIAVLDTGVDYTHEAFGSCSAPGGACKVVYAQDFATSDNSLDDDGHGTNVSGIALGVAPSAKIAALDVFPPVGGAYLNDIIAAIDWCVANQANYNITAINMSLGAGGYTSAVSPSDSWGLSIQRAVDANIVVVASSGNDASTNALSIPAAYSNVVSVGAVYDEQQNGSISYPVAACTDVNPPADKIACFSNSATFLTMLAPGAFITAAGIEMQGTSQAAPHVAGAAAVLRAAFPNDTVVQTVDRLTNGQPITDVRNGINKPRLDLELALTGAASIDTDGDGIFDVDDNCPTTSNADQRDANANGLGDACDASDTDGDGVSDAEEYAAGTDPARVGVLPPGYVFPEHITPLQLIPLGGPLDGQRPLPH